MLEECKIYKTNISISFLKVCNMDKGSIRIFFALLCLSMLLQYIVDVKYSSQRKERFSDRK